MIQFSLAVIALVFALAASADPVLGLPPVPVPAGNPVSPAKIKLGERLFADTRFSVTGTVSCASCHDPDKAFTDSPRQFSAGVYALTGTRNSPTVINAAFMRSQFWDGRALTLEEQALPPFVNPLEHGLTGFDQVLNVIRSDLQYLRAFGDAFGVRPDLITMDHVAKAIASFERTLIAGDSPFDRYYFLGDRSALSDEQVRGFQVFRGKGRCVSCHTIEDDYALFTDSRFYNTGIGIDLIQDQIVQIASEFAAARTTGVELDEDVLSNSIVSELGRFAVTGNMSDIGAFKTPTLRNVALTPPYMHDGSLETLKEVVLHFNRGGRRTGAPDGMYLSKEIKPLGLSAQEIDDLVAFLQALNSAQFERSK